MRKKGIAPLFVVGILFMSGCIKTEISPVEGASVAASQKHVGVYRKITADEAYAMMKEPDGHILLDVRTRKEFEEVHIKGAVLLPDYEIRDKAREKLPNRDAIILVYCRSGRRSAEAARQLVDMGYANVYDFGGIIDWPYDTVSGGN